MYVESPIPEVVNLSYDSFNKLLDRIGCPHIHEDDGLTVMLVVWGFDACNNRATYSCHKLFGDQQVTVQAIEEITDNDQIIKLIFNSDFYVVDIKQYRY